MRVFFAALLAVCLLVPPAWGECLLRADLPLYNDAPKVFYRLEKREDCATLLDEIPKHGAYGAFYLGLLHRDGRCVEKSPEKTQELMEHAARLGSFEAAIYLARIRFNPGRILRQRRSSRIRWA